jgi:hypothetical protein
VGREVAQGKSVAPEAHPHLYRKTTVRPGEDVTETESMAYPKLRGAFCLHLPVFRNNHIASHYAELEVDSQVRGKQK